MAYSWERGEQHGDFCTGTIKGGLFDYGTKTATNDAPKIYGDVCVRKRKERRKRRKLLLKELLYDYTKNSSLHGLRYIVERGLRVAERLFWLITFLMSISMCFYLITNVWIKWKTSPVIVSFSERVVPVGDVPFPSITICPQLKSKATVFNFSNEYMKYVQLHENITDFDELDQWMKLQDVNMVCGKDMVDVKSTREYANETMIDNFLEASIKVLDATFVRINVAPSVTDVFLDCEWRGKFIDCEEAFKIALTSEGICYNFNALAANEILRQENLQQEFVYLNTTRMSSDWSITEGYTDFRTEETYPRRGRENNAVPDLTVVLQETPEDRDGLCNSIKSGYTIYVQHPADLPRASLYYYAALPGQVSALALKFSMLITADALKSYPPEARQCYFPEDKELRYFRIYTSNNCRLECQSNYTFAKCGCVWYHMPHNDSRKICTNNEQRSCMVEALDGLSLAELKVKDVVKARPCQCLPSCNSIDYDAEILKTNFNAKTFLETQEKIHHENLSYYTSKNLSQIDVYFKEPRFISMRRSELFGVTDFLANCGGLLGLFLGFSFLSLVEIFYFGTLRLYYIFRRDLKEEKANREKQDLN